ncbi:hypothetical protein LJC58_07875 [Lachnospiraceae bacterium OttesenSCG-928-D06]|nr:hypothetical protein [Lachnospiraceae bacterium OttesenSCG-928-D06]
MTDHDSLDLLIQERVDMLLNNLRKSKPSKTPEENEQIVQAEQLINNLPNEKRELIQNYTNNYTDLFASV